MTIAALWKRRSERQQKMSYMSVFELDALLNYKGCLPVYGSVMKHPSSTAVAAYNPPIALCQLPPAIPRGGQLSFHKDFDAKRGDDFIYNTETLAPIDCRECCKIIREEPKWKARFNVRF